MAPDHPAHPAEPGVSLNGENVASNTNTTKMDPTVRLCIAVRMGGESRKVIPDLLAQGANIDGGNFITPPLLQAMQSGQLDNFRLLLELGANPNRRIKNLSDRALDDPELPTLLHQAARNGQTTNCLMLIAAGAQRQQVSEQGQTASLVAEAYGYNETAAAIAWPLHTAARRGLVKECLGMLGQGCDPDFRDHEGHTPVALARLHQKDQAADAMLSWQARKVSRQALAELGQRP